MSTEILYENERLTVTRIYSAPREAVFDAWIATSKVELWWGCADATEVKSEIEPRVGGRYHHNMTLHHTIEHRHHGVITEYDPPALLAYEMVGPTPDDITTVRVEFIALASGTKVQLTQDNLAEDISHFVMAGWSDGLNKLAVFLTKAIIPPT